jgi:hypothetical protein
VYINEIPGCLKCLEFIGQLDNHDFEGKYLLHAGGMIAAGFQCQLRMKFVVLC